MTLSRRDHGAWTILGSSGFTRTAIDSSPPAAFLPLLGVPGRAQIKRQQAPLCLGPFQPAGHAKLCRPSSLSKSALAYTASCSRERCNPAIMLPSYASILGSASALDFHLTG